MNSVQLWPDSETIRKTAAQVLRAPNLELALNPAWASGINENHRLEIRKHLSRMLGERGRENPSLLDLSQRPRDAKFSLSISHCPSLGGFAFLPAPAQIGFDIEEKNRISPAVAKRIQCDRDALPPTPAHLWVAKEAAFKCLHVDQQPKTLTQLFVHEWEQENSSVFLFKTGRADISLYLGGYGCVMKNGDWLFSFFLSTSQF